MSDDDAYLAAMEAQYAEADALLEDPEVDTATDPVDGDENLPTG